MLACSSPDPQQLTWPSCFWDQGPGLLTLSLSHSSLAVEMPVVCSQVLFLATLGAWHLFHVAPAGSVSACTVSLHCPEFLDSFCRQNDLPSHIIHMELPSWTSGKAAVEKAFEFLKAQCLLRGVAGPRQPFSDHLS